jgi:glutamate synthase domain-containing protein 2
MTAEERASSKTLVYQCLPSRYGFDPDDVRRADAIEIVIGQGAKPGGGGMLLGQKVNPRVARMRTLPEGVDQRSASRHPDWTGPDDLVIKIKELREITDWEKPIYVKVGATRVFNDVKLAVHAGADVIVVDGMQGGTAATQTVFIEHVGIPTLAALRQAVDALDDLNMRGTVQLVISGGIRSGADVAKALAMGADAVAIGQGVLVALGCNSDSYIADGRHVSALEDYAKLGTAPGFCHHCHTGKCPVGVTTQDAALELRLDPAVGAKRLRNYFKTVNMELTTIARACGKQDVHHLEKEDLVALTVEAAAMAGVPLAGTSWIPGRPG